MLHAGLLLQTRDFDFKIVAHSLESFTSQCELCLTALPPAGECALQRGTSPSFVHLVVHGNRVADFTWCPVEEYAAACAKYGPPERAGFGSASAAVPGLAGCAVMPAQQLVDLLQDDPSLPGWRRTKNRAQLERVCLAEQLGVWCLESNGHGLRSAVDVKEEDVAIGACEGSRGEG